MWIANPPYFCLNILYNLRCCTPTSASDRYAPPQVDPPSQDSKNSRQGAGTASKTNSARSYTRNRHVGCKNTGSAIVCYFLGPNTIHSPTVTTLSQLITGDCLDMSRPTCLSALFGQSRSVMPLIETPLTRARPATRSIVWGMFGVWIRCSVDTVGIVVIICF